MPETCTRSPFLNTAETLLVGGAALVLLWWWATRHLDHSRRAVKLQDAAVNTEALTSTDDVNAKEGFYEADRDLPESDVKTTWKGVWVGNETLGNTFTSHYRSELSVDLSTGHQTRKYEMMRHRNTHVIAAM